MAGQKSTNSEIAVLQTQMEELGKTVDRTESKVDRLLERFETTAISFVGRNEFNEAIEKFEADLKAARSINWLTHTLSGAFGVIITALIYYFISGGTRF